MKTKLNTVKKFSSRHLCDQDVQHMPKDRVHHIKTEDIIFKSYKNIKCEWSIQRNTMRKMGMGVSVVL